ncbi:UNVERIFIED_CONTAM: hypothetical protein PYX00_007076 [Menopon gallinae]|uniref:Hexosyltransferase n=1 Tax=Menopon gallinae TaxID=328185 RepID=A0AAW2HHL9_9NEOP
MKYLVHYLLLNKRTVVFCAVSFVLGYFYYGFVNEGFDLGDRHIYLGKAKKYMNGIGFRDPFLVILIFSGINNYSRREVIRSTWLSDVKTTEVVHFFAISAGSTTIDEKLRLEEEQKQNNDLLVFTELDDSFKLLTSKLIASFGWLTEMSVLGNKGKSSTEKHFHGFKFLLKCDDDTFVRVNELVTELKTAYSGKNGDNLYLGFFDGRSRPKRTGKYKEATWNICDYYIPYALGGGYVLAKPLIEYIARNGNYLTRFSSEDTSVGAWLSTYSQVNRVHDPRFDTEYISRGCHQSYLVTHKHSKFEMKKFHKNIKNTGKLCEKEYRTRLSYMYNWDVLPSANQIVGA